MECPFCVESIKDESLVCKHCARDLALVRPIIFEIQAMTIEIDALQRELNRVRIKLAAAEAPGRFLSVHALVYVMLPRSSWWPRIFWFRSDWTFRRFTCVSRRS